MSEFEVPVYLKVEVSGIKLPDKTNGVADPERVQMLVLADSVVEAVTSRMFVISMLPVPVLEVVA